MKCNVIASGSKGNAVVVFGDILIDCGVSLKTLKGVEKDLRLVLLTHIHSDHFKTSTIKSLAVLRPTLRFGCCKHLLESLEKCEIDRNRIDVMNVDTLYNYGEFSISPFQLCHDVPNVGWRIFRDGEKLIYATDTASMDGIEAVGYDLYLLEANYGEREIAERIEQKRQKGEFAYEEGVKRVHLSQEQCDAFMAANMRENSRYIYLHRHSRGDDIK